MMQAVLFSNYPSASPLLRARRSYQVVTRLQIGCFVLAAGRLVFLPAALQGKTYLLGRKAYRCGIMQCGEIHRPHEYYP